MRVSSIKARFDETHLAIGIGADAIQHMARIAAELRHARARIRIRADDACIGLILGEETRLRREVLLHRLVVVKMILREIAERSHAKMRSPDAPEIECMARNLACAGVDMRIDHPGKELLEVT